jgi:hypothetical protein
MLSIRFPPVFVLNEMISQWLGSTWFGRKGIRGWLHNLSAEFHRRRMRHAAGFGGEDASVLATAGITRKYDVEVISHCSPGGLVRMAATDDYLCAWWNLLNAGNRLGEEFFCLYRSWTKETQPINAVFISPRSERRFYIICTKWVPRICEIASPVVDLVFYCHCLGGGWSPSSISNRVMHFHGFSFVK